MLRLAVYIYTSCKDPKLLNYAAYTYLKWHKVFYRLFQSLYGKVGCNKYAYFMLGLKPLSAMAAVITLWGATER
jgi:hypothetical protein